MENTTESSVIRKAQKHSSINVDNIFLDSKRKKGIVQLFYNSEVFNIQTPFLQVLGSITPSNFPSKKHFITAMNSNSKTSEKRIKKFINSLEQIEDKVVTQIAKIGNKWFSNQDINFIPMIRETKNIDAHIKWTFDIDDTMFIDDNKNSLGFDSIKEGVLVKLIIEIPAIWINKKENQCGMIVNVKKTWIKQEQNIKPQPILKNEYIFDDETASASSSSEENNDTSLFMTEQKLNEKKFKLNTNNKKKTVTFDSPVQTNVSNISNISNISNVSNPDYKPHSKSSKKSKNLLPKSLVTAATFASKPNSKNKNLGYMLNDTSDENEVLSDDVVITNKKKKNNIQLSDMLDDTGYNPENAYKYSDLIVENPHMSSEEISVEKNESESY